MDKLFEALSKGPLWLLVAALFVYALLSNFDKVSPLLSKPNAIEKATRDVKELLDRQKQASDMGQHHLSRYIGVHLSGVLAPKVLRIIKKEVEREIKRSQPPNIKHRLLLIFGVYAVFMAIYGLFFMSLYSRAYGEWQITSDHPFLSFLVLVASFLFGMWIIQRLYAIALERATNKVNEDYNKKFDAWMARYDLIPHNPGTDNAETSTPETGSPE